MSGGWFDCFFLNIFYVFRIDKFSHISSVCLYYILLLILPVQLKTVLVPVVVVRKYAGF